MFIPKLWLYLAACVCFLIAAFQKSYPVRFEWLGAALLVAAQL